MLKLLILLSIHLRTTPIMEIAKELLLKFDTEDASVQALMRDDAFGLVLLTALKESDYYYYNLVRNEETERSSEHFYLIYLGLPQLIRNAFVSCKSYLVPTLTFRSDESLIKGSFERLARLGMIQHGRRMCFGAIAGECEIFKVNDTLYEFYLPKELFNYEGHEGEVQRHYADQANANMEEVLNKHFEENNLLESIDSLLAENSYVFSKHFIGYNAHPLLDHYFFYMAKRKLNGPAFDTFRHDVMFGGLQYSHYYICLCFLVSLATKHEHFCQALVKKNPNIRLRDILTITCDKHPFIEDIYHAVNQFGKEDEIPAISIKDAEQLYKVFSLRRDNLPLTIHADFPMLVEYSSSTVIRSVAGAKFRPGEFLLESLKFNFPTDYDRNQNDREGSMQRAIERILKEFSTSVQTRRNIALKKEGMTLTDIDFVAIDEDQQTVLLFQLKHQDEYGIDMKKRSSRGKRLTDETSLWLEQVSAWIESSSHEEINSALRLRKGFEINDIYFVAIAKNFAHFLSSLSVNTHFVYGTWMQFCDAITRIERLRKVNTLSNLFEVMREYMTHKIARPQQHDDIDEYVFDTFSFRVSKKE